MQDKKKLVVLGVLVAVILGVGAFSFMGGGSKPAPAVATKTEPKKTDAANGEQKVDENGNVIVDKEGEEAPTNPLYAAELPQRDPFQTFPLEGTQPTVNTVAQPKANPLPAANSGRRSGGRRSGGGGNISIPPMPIPGNLEGPLGITPTGPDPSAFGYQVSGVIVGSKPAAVFTDSGGNQRLVPVGGSLDGDSKVVSIDKGQVTVEHRGKKLRLPLGGNPQ